MLKSVHDMPPLALNRFIRTPAISSAPSIRRASTLTAANG